MYPNRNQYKVSVLNELYPVEDNGGYTFSPVKVNNELVFASGGNATVFKLVDLSGNILAVKFFTDEISERFVRYENVSNFLRECNFPFIVDFKFVKNLIYVEIDGQPEVDSIFPGLIMKWIEAPTLETKLKNLIETNDVKSILKVAKSFKELAINILDHNFSHGDLKLSNLLVDNNLRLFLIDYDGMFIEEFRGSTSFELGTPSYQHPKRTIFNFDENIDDFSILLIYTSLIALAYYPELYKYNDGDNIIFTLEDFKNPNKSELFNFLSSKNETKALVFYLKQSLLSQSIYIENVKNLLKGKYPKSSISISHSPKIPLIGQIVKIDWKTSNVDFLKISGLNYPLNGYLEEIVIHNHKFEFEFGNSIDTQYETYKIKSIPKPEILNFAAKNSEIKFDESVNLLWEIKNYKEAKLIYDSFEIDIKNLKNINIDGIKKDTFFILRLISEIDNYIEEKQLKIEVFYPVSLNIKQDKKITFPNRAVKINIEAVNAQKITLVPSNIDLTGMSNYEIITDKDYHGQIFAENKRYSSTFQNIEIEVLKIPQRPHLVAKLPPIVFKISTPRFVRINRPEPNKVAEIIIQFKNVFEYLNIFKISTNLKRIYETRRK
jgi:hypothetical protein